MVSASANLDQSDFDGLTPEQQERLSLILDQYFNGLERGEPVSHQVLVEEHPDLADQLTEYLESIEYLQNAAAGFVNHESEQTGPFQSNGGTHPDQETLPDSEKRLGDFKLLRELGRGGMGVVYEAQQISLDRRVAVKVLPFAALLDAKQIARFKNEAHAAAQLHHPRIVPVFAVGVERGVNFYAMQLIDGQPLSDAIIEMRRFGESDPEQTDDTVRGFETHHTHQSTDYCRAISEIGIQVADALQAAHELGIVHRDIKPSNLLLDVEGDVWVTDFGLARCRGESNLTRTGDFVGTMRYMSPEQTKGESQYVDHRTDIYSLGVTLYELLTLRHAVRGDSPVEIVRELEREYPYRPTVWNQKIPQDLENIVLKAMSKSRDDRYGSAREFAEDLQRFLDGKPTVARQPSALDRLGKWVLRHQKWTVSIAAVVAVALVGMTFGNFVLSRQKAATEAALADARLHYQQYRSQLAIARNHLALLHERNGETEQAESTFLDAIKLQEEILAEESDNADALRGLASSLSNLGFMYSKKSPQRAAEMYQQSVGHLKRLVKYHPERPGYRRELALGYNNLGSFYRRCGDPESALKYLRDSVRILSDDRDGVQRTSEWDRDLAVSFNNLGMARHTLNQLSEAEQSFRKGLELLTSAAQQESASPKDLSSLGGIYNNLGMVLEKQGELEEAADAYQRAIEFQTAAVKKAPQATQFHAFLAKHHDNQERVRSALARGTRE